ncbi:hypothetical protein BJV78DRAFT_1155522 [Lactifluus subvellereus]|nr:hypothetical protein BJV78DRAFT_1155522 [Lactifluus subvellereus]
MSPSMERRSLSWGHGRRREKNPFTYGYYIFLLGDGGRGGRVLIERQRYGRLHGVKARMRDDESAWFARALRGGLQCQGDTPQEQGRRSPTSVTINGAAAMFDGGGGRWIVGYRVHRVDDGDDRVQSGHMRGFAVELADLECEGGRKCGSAVGETCEW